MSARRSEEREAPVCTDYSFGGQAVIEGVMMRGRNCWAVAVRRPSGGIARVAFPLDPPGSRNRLLRLPVVRGVVALFDSMRLGIRALGISANIGLEEVDADGSSGVAASAATADTDLSAQGFGSDPAPATEQAPAPAGKVEEEPFGWKQLAVTVGIALVMAVGLFVVIPLTVVKVFEDTFANPFVFNLVEGLIRIAIFLLYIVGISLIPDLRRVFMYHGAEHKVIHAFEAYGRPDAEKAAGFSTLHPRCGTGFLLIVMVLSVFLFAFVGKPPLPWLVLSRLIGIPIIIGIAYEIGIKGLGKHPNGLLARTLLWPGLQLQRLTTREPTPDQLEVAAAALEEAVAMDRSEQQAGLTVPAVVSA